MEQKPKIILNTEEFRYTREVDFRVRNKLPYPDAPFDSSALDSGRFSNYLKDKFDMYSWDRLTSAEMEKVFAKEWRKCTRRENADYVAVNKKFAAVDSMFEKSYVYKVLQKQIQSFISSAGVFTETVVVQKGTTVPGTGGAESNASERPNKKLHVCKEVELLERPPPQKSAVVTSLGAGPAEAVNQIVEVKPGEPPKKRITPMLLVPGQAASAGVGGKPPPAPQPSALEKPATPPPTQYQAMPLFLSSDEEIRGTALTGGGDSQKTVVVEEDGNSQRTETVEENTTGTLQPGQPFGYTIEQGEGGGGYFSKETQ
jgi:hypothetical protein